MKTYNTWNKQIEILPRLTIVYGDLIAFEWLWFGVWHEFKKQGCPNCGETEEISLYGDKDVTWNRCECGRTFNYLDK